MKARAVNKYIRQSAKKMKPVLDMVRGKQVNSALNMLSFMPKKSAKLIELTTRSAVSNLLNSEEGAKLNPDELIIREAYVNQGPVMKRIRPRSMGRAFMIRKRSCHLTVVVGTPEDEVKNDTKEKE
ncbi:MAG: 50S ribosomal protein L22 [Candidatus Marinimicrobia bacterium]|jgi:large subunit ribosomal protein L22|nr:50S ribosomal protein L22 [Candidatus Neomarinimicrobiota bacterium]MDD4960689.1 50S ribosomal protein L22 [Candidatus Neomarinimicrobiota bacterium]MDD5709192.1 50S ribosomal protein L22 [Candidatus Neomarinimicrobiota bacterium]MDX9778271.1 50S ribosomal protein L22 [bacterium]